MLELGLGALEVLSAGGRGTVVAVFAKAVYARFPSGLVALTTAEVPSGPLHARGAYPAGSVHVGDTLTVEPAGAEVWRGAMPSPVRLAAGSETALALLAGAPASALVDPAFEVRLASATTSLGAGDLDGVVDALGGLGPGLTPAGDDTLAGLLLVAHGMGQPGLALVAARTRTNDIAGAFLAWAARGQSIEPVHRFLAAAADGDQPDAASALDRLLAYGHSSGADLALGLRLGLHAFCCTGSVNAA